MPQYGMVLTGPQMGANTESITNIPLTSLNFPTLSFTDARSTRLNRYRNVTTHRIPNPSLQVSHPNNESKWRVSEASTCNIPIAMIKTGTKFLHPNVWLIHGSWAAQRFRPSYIRWGTSPPRETPPPEPFKHRYLSCKNLYFHMGIMVIFLLDIDMGSFFLWIDKGMQRRDFIEGYVYTSYPFGFEAIFSLMLSLALIFWNLVMISVLRAHSHGFNKHISVWSYYCIWHGVLNSKYTFVTLFLFVMTFAIHICRKQSHLRLMDTQIGLHWLGRFLLNFLSRMLICN